VIGDGTTPFSPSRPARGLRPCSRARARRAAL